MRSGVIDRAREKLVDDLQPGRRNERARQREQKLLDLMNWSNRYLDGRLNMEYRIVDTDSQFPNQPQAHSWLVPRPGLVQEFANSGLGQESCPVAAWQGVLVRSLFKSALNG